MRIVLVMLQSHMKTELRLSGVFYCCLQRRVSEKRLRDV